MLLAVFAWRCADDVLSLTKPDAEVTVTIADGATISQIAKELRDSGLVRSETLFKLYCWATHAERTIEPGTYSLNSRYDYHALVSNMVEAAPTALSWRSLSPKATSARISSVCWRKTASARIRIWRTPRRPTNLTMRSCQEIPYGSENRLEGYLFPDTYQFYMGDDPENVIDKFLRNFDNKFTQRPSMTRWTR